MNDTVNNESNVNDDNGVTYASGSDNAYLVGKVWSIGLAREVEVIGHATDQSEDAWLVSVDEDGDLSPDNAVRRAGSDLLPVFAKGTAVNLPLRVDGEWTELSTLGVVTNVTTRQLFVATAESMSRGSGWTNEAFTWEWVRERFHEGRLTSASGHAADLACHLYKHATSFADRLNRAEQREAEAVSALETFKHEVAVVASRYGREHEMCAVLDEALAELGLERITQRWEVEVTLTRTFRINADSAERAEERVRYIVDGIEWSSDESDEEFEEWGELDKSVSSAEDVSS